MARIQETAFATKFFEMEARPQNAMGPNTADWISMSKPIGDFQLPPNVIVKRRFDIDAALANASDDAKSEYAFNSTPSDNVDKDETDSIYAFEKIDGCRCDKCTGRVHKSSSDKLDEVASVNVFEETANDSDEKDEVESMYAFDYQATSIAAMEPLTIKIEKVDLQMNDAKPMETEDVESVYTFEGTDSSDVSSNTDGYGVEADVPDKVEEVAPKTKTEVDTRELVALSCLTFTSALLALICRLCDHVEIVSVFVGPALLFSCCFIYNYVNDLRMKALQRRLDVEWARSTRLVIHEAEVDTTEDDEADDGVESVYAFDANDVDETVEIVSGLATDETEIDVTQDDEIIYTIKDVSESAIEERSPCLTTAEAEINTTEDNNDVYFVYAYDANADYESDIDASETEEVIDSAEDDSESAVTDDDAASVHTYDAIDVSDSSDLTTDESEIDTTEAEEVIDAVEDASESAVITEGNSPFGFNIPNHGQHEPSEYEDNDYKLRFNERVTTFWTKATGESLTLIFKRQDLQWVLYRDEGYTSFAALPTKVADLLVTARVLIVALKH
uniref:Tudor domain-containing protein n=1 Tax=Panagrellus redivivus TaxID=6233 RepID=A0A7E4ZQR9_PANRE